MLYFVKEGSLLTKMTFKTGDAKVYEVLIEENNIKSLKENVNLQRILSKVSDLIRTGERQIELVTEELGGIKSLVEDGYAPKVQQIKF